MSFWKISFSYSRRKQIIFRSSCCRILHNWSARPRPHLPHLSLPGGEQLRLPCVWLYFYVALLLTRGFKVKTKKVLESETGLSTSEKDRSGKVAQCGIISQLGGNIIWQLGGKTRPEFPQLSASPQCLPSPLSARFCWCNHSHPTRRWSRERQNLNQSF